MLQPLREPNAEEDDGHQEAAEQFVGEEQVEATQAKPAAATDPEVIARLVTRASLRVVTIVCRHCCSGVEHVQLFHDVRHGAQLRDEN